MGPWHLEALRLWRTRRLVALGAVFVLLGFGDPVLLYYLPDLVSKNASGARVNIPPPTPAAALTSFGQSVAQLGTLVVIIVAAACLAIDSKPSLAAFYRTRQRRQVQLILPRCVVVGCASLVMLLLGVLGAWYETNALIGAVQPAAIAGGFAIESLWIVFVICVVAGWSSVSKSVLAITGWSLASLLGMVLMSNIGALARWLPTQLASGVGSLVGPHRAGVPWQAIMVTAVVAVVVFGFATRRVLRRET